MTIAERLFEAKEYYAAGLFEYPEKSAFFRHANAYLRFMEHYEPAPYDGGSLYPCGRGMGRRDGPEAVQPDMSFTFTFERDRLRGKVDDECYNAMVAEYEKVTGFPTPHTVGGAGYTHSFINYERILRDGICGYRARVEALPESEFKDGLKMALQGIELYRRKILANLASSEKVYPGLMEAMAHADEPPRTLYEALVLWNFVYYVDGCDDIGRLDKHLYRFYKGENIVDQLHELYVHIDTNDGWSGPLGPDYNELTLQCIRAAHYIRRPNLQLRVKPDMDDAVWNEVYGSLGTSCGQPALYNELAFQEMLHREFPEMPECDRERLAFGGCTETMLEGISNVGSDDSGLNAALIYDRFTRDHLGEYERFEDYFDGLCEQMNRETAEVLDILDSYRRTRAKYRPRIIRTLFVDDCIDKGLDFNAGGARYYWSVSNVAGLINTIDSVSVVRELVFRQKRYTAQSFFEALDSQDEAFVQAAAECPCFGVDDPEIDSLAGELAGRIYDGYATRPCYPSGKYFTVSNQFTTYEEAGRCVSATPDGRKAFEPLCDSLGAVHGKDVKGPTALLNSVSSLPLNRVFGTPIMNIRIRREHLPTLLKPLVTGFFENGGMQLQVSCLSREEMLDAVAHPERHQNLVVRIGGYSEYFVRLSPVLQQTVLARTEY